MSCQNMWCQNRIDDLLGELDSLKGTVDERDREMNLLENERDNALYERDAAETKLAQALEAIRWAK